MNYNSFKPVYAIVAKNASEVDIMLYGIIGDSYWSQGNSGRKFVSDFAALEAKYDRINIRINSPGGSVDEGLPMFNAIKSSKKDTHTYVDGIAYSMGAMIAMAGKTVHAAKGSLMMLHCVSGGAMGNAKDLRDTANTMDVYDDVLGTLIADKTGKTVAQVKKDWMNYDDHFMSAQTAFENKLVDVVENYDAKVPENVSNMKTDQLMAFYNPTAGEPGAPDLAALAAQVSTLIQNKDMLGFNRYPSLAALKGKKAADVTAADVLAVNQEIVADGTEGITLVLDSAMEAANNAGVANTTALTAVNAALPADKQAKTLSEGIAALVALNGTQAGTIATLNTSVTTITGERDGWKTKAEAYGPQPGAMPTAAVVKKDENGNVIVETPVDDAEENKFETSVDREYKKLQAARKGEAVK